jgi:hypothetical protein
MFGAIERPTSRSVDTHPIPGGTTKQSKEEVRTMSNASRKHAGFRVTAAVQVGLAVVLATSAAWGQSRCTSDKYKAAGKYAYTLAKCHAKAVAGGIPVDPVCESNGLTKLQTSFAKAETRGDCIVAGQQQPTAAATQQYVNGLGSIIEVNYPCCYGGNMCYYSVDDATCTGSGGTVGPAGSVCNAAAGSCTPPPAAAGNCCDNFPLFGTTGCVSGQGLDASGCAFFNATFHANTVCGPAGTCAP